MNTPQITTKFLGTLFLLLLLSNCKNNDSNCIKTSAKAWPFVCDSELTAPFVGINIDSWRFSIDQGEVYSYEDFYEMFAQAKTAAGATVIRLHLHGYTFEPSVGNYNETAFVQLDKFIKAAGDNDMQVLICLRDYMWAPWPTSSYDPYWSYGSSWAIGQPDLLNPAPNKDAILKEPGAIAAYKNFITHVLTRENTLTSVTYASDPVIWGWEIINEPKVEIGVLKPWIDDVVAYAKTLTDLPIGIATVGVEPTWWSSGSSLWGELDSAELDFIAIHYYADSSLYKGTPDTNNIAVMRDRFRAATSLGKPVYLTEFGCINTTDRQTMIHLYATIMSVAMEEGIGGVIPYSWGPHGPRGWGGPKSYCITEDYKDLCLLMKTLSDHNK